MWGACPGRTDWHTIGQVELPGLLSVARGIILAVRAGYERGLGNDGIGDIVVPFLPRIKLFSRLDGQFSN